MYVRSPPWFLPLVRLRVGRLGRDMYALGRLLGVQTALGTYGAIEDGVSSPVRHYIGIAILQNMLCTRLMPSTLHATCVSADCA